MQEKRIALVTGANKGLGFETSRQLAQLGIRVLMGARNRTKGRAAAKKLMGQGLEVEFVRLDVTKAGHIEQIARHIEESCGRLDILINNAGISHPEEPLFGNSVETVSAKALKETFAVNFIAPVRLTQALLPLLKKSAAGRIVNVSSVLGSLTRHSDPRAGLEGFKPLAYDASKAALNQLTIHLAAALAETPIKVNSAHPGWVKTDMGGAQAPMDVEEGAKTAVRLATLGPEGPSGGFFHLTETIPW